MSTDTLGRVKNISRKKENNISDVLMNKKYAELFAFQTTPLTDVVKRIDVDKSQHLSVPANVFSRVRNLIDADPTGGMGSEMIDNLSKHFCKGFTNGSHKFSIFLPNEAPIEIRTARVNGILNISMKTASQDFRHRLKKSKHQMEKCISAQLSTKTKITILNASE